MYLMKIKYAVSGKAAGETAFLLIVNSVVYFLSFKYRNTFNSDFLDLQPNIPLF